MRICYVANSRFPSERAHMTQIVHMCNAFSRVGSKVTLLVTDRSTQIQEDPEAFYGVPILFHIERIAVPDIAGASPKIPPILRPYAFMLQRLVYTFRSYVHIRNNQYDCVYGRDEWILWLLTRLVKVRCVWESHEARFSYAARRLLRRIPTCVVISEGIRNFYIAKKVPQEKIFVAHDAIDERFFEKGATTAEARTYLGIEEEKLVVMYIGGFESWKGIETFLQAAEKQSLYQPYCIGGKEQEIVKYKEKYPQVHFLGQKPYRDLHLFQQAADILIIPNSAREKISLEYTSPLKLYAHMASQKPIVAARVPSITTVLSDEEAYFFEPDNPQSLNETIQFVHDHIDAARVKAGCAYRKSIASTWTNRARSILETVCKNQG